jgi:hypothetical protein
VAGVVFAVQVAAGGLDAGVAQVLAHHQQGNASIQLMAGGGMAQPVGAGLQSGGCAGFLVCALLAAR